MVNLKKLRSRSGYKKIIENAKKYKADAKIVGVLVQEMAPQSTEVIVGAIKDPQFGQTVMFGLGGIFVELLKDVNFRVAPITTEDAKEMITQLKAFPLLNGLPEHASSRHRCSQSAYFATFHASSWSTRKSKNSTSTQSWHTRKAQKQSTQE